MRVGVCLPGGVRVGFGVIYVSWCLFTMLCWCCLRYVLCELVFVFQVVFVLASVRFMRVGVCFPGSVRADR